MAKFARRAGARQWRWWNVRGRAAEAVGAIGTIADKNYFIISTSISSGLTIWGDLILVLQQFQRVRGHCIRQLSRGCSNASRRTTAM